MIKLKNILFEESSEEKFIELKNLIDSGEYILTDNLIYRGSSGKSDKQTDTFEIYDIRIDRMGRSSCPFANDLFNKLLLRFNPEIPTRNKILFCSSDRGIANIYGYLYIVLPRKDSEIYSFTSDSWYVLTHLAAILHKIQTTVSYKEKIDIGLKKYIPITYKFFNLLENDLEKQSINFFIKYYEKIKNEMDNIKNKEFENIVNGIVFDMALFFRAFTIYKEQYKKINNINNIPDNLSEIWIVGKDYCLVNEKFYKQFMKKYKND